MMVDVGGLYQYVVGVVAVCSRVRRLEQVLPLG